MQRLQRLDTGQQSIFPTSFREDLHFQMIVLLYNVEHSSNNFFLYIALQILVLAKIEEEVSGDKLGCFMLTVEINTHHN